MAEHITIQEVKSLMATGDIEAARQLLAETDFSNVSDPEFHIEAGDVAAELGEHARAASEFELALRDDRENNEALHRLAVLWVDCLDRQDVNIDYPVHRVRQFASCLEKKAGELAGQNNDGAKAYERAARAWYWLSRAKPRDPFYASKHITCRRKAGASNQEVLDLCRDAFQRHPGSTFVQNQLAWSAWRVMKDAAERGDSEEVVERATEACLVATGPEAGGLFSAVVSGLSKFYKSLNTEPKEQEKTARAMVELIAEKGRTVVEHLDAGAEQGRKCSNLESFFYLVRKAAKQAKAWDLLEEFMTLALERYPRNQWFAQARVEALIGGGKLVEALEAAKGYWERMQDNTSIAMVYADALDKCGETERAAEVMAMACRNDKSPWSWQKLAGFLEESGRLEEAQQALACGLAFQEPSEPIKVWKLHFTRARLLKELGQGKEAAKEAWLLKEARKDYGWNKAGDARGLVAELEVLFQGFFQELDSAAPGVVRKQALQEYKGVLDAHRKKETLQGVVKWFKQEKGFGFVKLDDGKEAFLHKSVVKDADIEKGTRVMVRVTPAFDKKKGKIGLKVTWLKLLS